MEGWFGGVLQARGIDLTNDESRKTKRNSDCIWSNHVQPNELLAALQGEPVHYWRDKAGHEVDFVLKRRGLPPLAIECKWAAGGVPGREPARLPNLPSRGGESRRVSGCGPGPCARSGWDPSGFHESARPRAPVDLTGACLQSPWQAMTAWATWARPEAPRHRSLLRVVSHWSECGSLEGELRGRVPGRKRHANPTASWETQGPREALCLQAAAVETIAEVRCIRLRKVTKAATPFPRSLSACDAQAGKAGQTAGDRQVLAEPGPGGSSVPPGIPLHHDPEGLA